MKRYLALRARLKLEGKINHEEQLIKDDGAPIRDLQHPWVRWVAKQHGHSVRTMLETYAAWLEGTTEADLRAIQRAMEGPQRRHSPLNSLP